MRKLTSKRNNYLLRSTRSDLLIRIMVLTTASRTRRDGVGYHTITRTDGTWSANCNWEMEQLIKCGMVIETDDTYHVTDHGRESLTGALAKRTDIVPSDYVRELMPERGDPAGYADADDRIDAGIAAANVAAILDAVAERTDQASADRYPLADPTTRLDVSFRGLGMPMMRTVEVDRCGGKLKAPEKARLLTADQVAALLASPVPVSGPVALVIVGPSLGSAGHKCAMVGTFKDSDDARDWWDHGFNRFERYALVALTARTPARAPMSGDLIRVLHEAAAEMGGFVHTADRAEMGKLVYMGYVAVTSTTRLRYITPAGRDAIGVPHLVGPQPVCVHGPRCTHHSATK